MRGASTLVGAAALALLCTTSGAADGRPPSISLTAEFGAETKMLPDPATTRRIRPGTGVSWVQLLVTDDSPTRTTDPKGSRCSGFAMRDKDAHEARMVVFTAAHCFVDRSFTLQAGKEHVPPFLVITEETRPVTLRLGLQPHADVDATIRFHPSLAQRFVASSTSFTWAGENAEENHKRLFFPGGEPAEASWPVDVARIEVREKALPVWATDVVEKRLMANARSAAFAENEKLRVFVGGCVISDPEKCRTMSTAYERYDDSGFVFRRRLGDGKRAVLRSTSSSVVMPGDSGGVVLAKLGPGLAAIVGVVSARTSAGELVVASVPQDLY
jgi:hypothetical protein